MDQDKLAKLMLEDLRTILKAEVDENLTPTIEEEIAILYDTIFYNQQLMGVQKILLPQNKTSDIPGGINIIYYNPNPTWKEWFLDCLGL